ncbi:MAG: hypothetical protein ACKPKO_01020, partial [Candidatus Fonsibacter sp.]
HQLRTRTAEQLLGGRMLGQYAQLCLAGLIDPGGAGVPTLSRAMDDTSAAMTRLARDEAKKNSSKWNALVSQLRIGYVASGFGGHP